MGLIALASLAVGVILYLRGDPAHQFACGILVRVGCLLAAIWLAWPQLDALKGRVPTLVLGCLLALLLIVAIRPRIFPIAAAIMLATIFVNGAIRRFTGKRVR